MKRFILLAITCIVLDQMKAQEGWLTRCRGQGVDGQVVFDQELKCGQEVKYTPFIAEGDEFIHGDILGMADGECKRKPARNYIAPGPGRESPNDGAGKKAW